MIALAACRGNREQGASASPPSGSAGTDRVAPADAAARVDADVARAALRPPPAGKPRLTITLESKTKFSAFGLRFATDGRLIAAADVIAEQPRTIAVRVWRIDGGKAIEEAVLPPPDPEVRVYADGIALDGNTLAVASNVAIYLFRRDAGTWTLADRVDLTGALACGDVFPEDLALENNILVLADQSRHLCIYEQRDGSWRRTAELDGERPFGGYAPFVFDGESLVVIRPDTENCDIYRRAVGGGGWRKVSTIDPPADRESAFAQGVIVEGSLALVGMSTNAHIFDISASPPQRLGIVEAQQYREVPSFGRHMALRRPILAVYNRDHTDLFVERNGMFHPSGSLFAVRDAARISGLDRIAISDLIWIGETDGNTGRGPLIGGGRLYGYRWD